MYLKKLFVTFSLLFSAFIFHSEAQPIGQWTWMNGSNLPNQPAVFGTQGIFAPTNTPPALYEACEWTDLNGNFWLFGGGDLNGTTLNSDLWEFNPVTNEWAWMKGPGITNQNGVYGTINVAAPTNNPGARQANPTWVDNAGDLWLFGGKGFDFSGAYSTLSDLWKYNIASNEWTWVNGPNTVNGTGSFGTILVPSPTNIPPSRFETNASWTGNANTLWLFGGAGSSGSYSDLWKYDIGTNEWTWMKGPSTVNQPGVYGTIGIPNPANTPSSRYIYSKWKDSNGNFWMFGGLVGNWFINDLWMFNPITNDWTWVSGPNTTANTGQFGTHCIPSTGNLPSCRTEGRACWTLGCDNFRTFGGIGTAFYNDMWNYHVATNEWTWVSGNSASSFGTITVSSATNMPPNCNGSLGWTDNSGNHWLFGGYGNMMWRYVPDSTCPAINNPLFATFTNTPDTGCASSLFSFTNTSVGGTSFHWDFGDGNTSALSNPTHSFLTAGLDTVTLVVTWNNACGHGTDSVKHTVLVLASDVVNLGNDTSLCLGQSLTLNAGNPGAVYLWSTTETTQTISVNTTGSYWVIVGTGACADTDTVLVTFIQPIAVALGNDTNLCQGQIITLNAGNAGATYLWSTGAITQTISVATAGTYWVKVSAGSCIGVDTITVSFTSLPVINLGPDQSLCAGQSITLNAGNPGDTYLWSNGMMTQSITVAINGSYWVVVTNGICIGKDTINVSFNAAPTVNLGADKIICQGQTDTLDAGNPGLSFFWNTSETSQKIIVSSTGIYWVGVSLGGCISYDTISLIVEKVPPIPIRKDTFICPGTEMELTALKGYKTYSWLPGGEGSYSIIVDKPGSYILNVTDTNDCPAEGSVLIREYCLPVLNIPNSFTPNGNQMNDFFLAISDGALDFHMYIFNRWGELVFESTDISKGWDGKHNGNNAPEGVYIYRIDYSMYEYLELIKHSKFGNVNLIR